MKNEEQIYELMATTYMQGYIDATQLLATAADKLDKQAMIEQMIQKAKEKLDESRQEEETD
jgi:hypothetical protein